MSTQKLKKIIMPVIAFVIISIILVNFNHVYAELNMDYANSTAEVDDATLDKVAKDNAILRVLAGAIYWVGLQIEAILGWFGKVTTGMTVFPWADMILFNAVPMFDINFINPASNSLIASFSGLLRTIYFTIMGLSVAFFSISVVLLGVKMATSVIASDKASYKESLVKWVWGLVLLFTIHYFIAFVFYLNESTVKIASSMATKSLESVSGFVININEQLVDNLNDMIDMSTLSDDVKNKIKSMVNTPEKQKLLEEYLGNADSKYKNILKNLTPYTGSDWKNKLVAFLRTNNGVDDTIKGMGDLLSSISTIKLDDIKWMKDYKYEDTVFGKDDATVKKIENQFSNYPELKKAFIESTLLGQKTIEIDKVRAINEYYALSEKYHNEFASASNQTGDSADPNKYKVTPIARLAEYFKKAALSPNTGAIVATKASLSGAIMYVIFVGQSLLFFFAYIKRLFYVIILGMMAPALVVFDFNKKDGNVLTNWIKEFIALVFVQTIQAFLFAIVVIVIVFTGTSTKATGQSDEVKNSAMGLVGIVGLASIAKIEELVKSMIGLKSSITDPTVRGGLKSLMAGAAIGGFAAKRLSKNFGTMKGAFGAGHKAKKDLNKLNERYKNRMAAMGIDHNPTDDSSGGGANTGSHVNNSGANNEGNNPYTESSQVNQDENYDPNRDGRASGANAASANNATGQQGTNTGKNVKKGVNNLSSKDKLEILKMKEEYEDGMDKIKQEKNKKRINAVKELGSTVASTAIGATVGLGALATSDGSKALSTAAATMGVTDMAVDKLGNAVEGIVKLPDTVEKRIKTHKEYKESVKEMQERTEILNKWVDKINKESDISDVQ